MKKPILVFLSVLLIFFLATAFVNWEINPGKWGKFPRLFLVLAGLPVAGMLAMASKDFDL